MNRIDFEVSDQNLLQLGKGLLELQELVYTDTGGK